MRRYLVLSRAVPSNRLSPVCAVADLYLSLSFLRLSLRLRSVMRRCSLLSGD